MKGELIIALLCNVIVIDIIKPKVAIWEYGLNINIHTAPHNNTATAQYTVLV